MKKQLRDNDIATLAVMTALILGGLLRFTPPGLTGFPVNDGGMFYTMISDLAESNYRLPAFTSYNGSTIPFAYPPLGFYIARIITDIFHISTLEILTWLPACISTITILAFYLLAREILGSPIQASLATIIFAISPRSFSWFIMGGGLTRAFGMLNMLLTLYSTQKLFREPNKKHLAFTILFGGLTVLSHPEAIIHTISAAGLLWLTTARNRTAFMSTLQVSLGVIVLTSPWWVTVLLQHGPTPFIAGNQSGQPLLFLAIISYYFTEELMMTFIAVLSIIGIFTELSRKKYFLALWVVISFLVDGRSAAWVANIAMTMLAAIALDKVILVGLAMIKAQVAITDHRSIYKSGVARLLLGYIFIYIVGGSYLFDLAMASIHVNNSQREAMSWVHNNTPVGSRFILLTPGSDYPMRDPVQEWFPALTKRISLTTLQGKEWTLGSKFGESFAIYKELQACATQEEIECVFTQMPIIGGSFDYIYINKKSNYELGSAWSSAGYNPKLVKSALETGNFALAYESQSVVILSLQKIASH